MAKLSAVLPPGTITVTWPEAATTATLGAADAETVWLRGQFRAVLAEALAR
jgi:hypothetical protein